MIGLAYPLPLPEISSGYPLDSYHVTWSSSYDRGFWIGAERLAVN